MGDYNEMAIKFLAEKTFIIKNGDGMYEIFTNLWRLLHWRARCASESENTKCWDTYNDFRKRFLDINIYFNALDLAKEFTEKIGFKLVKEKE